LSTKSQARKRKIWAFRRVVSNSTCSYKRTLVIFSQNLFIERITVRLILKSLSLSLEVTSQFEVLSTFNRKLMVLFACGALKLQHVLLSGFSFLVENWFGLTSITRLFTIVTSLSLSPNTFLSLLVLGDFVRSVLLALFAKGVTLFWDVDL